MNTWHIKKKRQKTGSYDLNCLFQNDNIFVMDNHKAALWSWLQIVDDTSNYNFLHIDRHYDLLNSAVADWVSRVNEVNNGNLKNYSISEYDELEYEGPISEIPVFRFDNFFPIGHEIYPDLFEELIFITHKDGQLPDEYDVIEKSIFDTGENLSYWIEDLSNRNDNNWIVDLDIDFFFSDNTKDQPCEFLSTEYAKLIAKQLYEIRDLIEVLTIALSPGFCTTWDKSIEFANIFCDQFGFHFEF